MDDTAKLFIAQLGIAGVLLIWINSWISRLYADFQEERKAAAVERAKLLDGQFDLKQRVGRLEEHIIGDRSPTMHTNPLSNGKTGVGS